MSGSNQSSNGSRIINPSKPSFNHYAAVNNPNGSRIASSSSSNPSSHAAGYPRKVSNSEDKYLEPIHQPTKANRAGQQNAEEKLRNVKIIQDYGLEKEIAIPENKIVLPLKPPAKLQDSLLAISSPSRGSVLTNPQQPGGRFDSSLNNSNTQDSYPLKPGKAIQIFKNVLTEYEKGEILNYREIY